MQSATTPHEAEAPPGGVEHSKVLTERDLADFVWPLHLGGKDRADLAFHGRRWLILLEHADALVEAARARGGPLRILDIGPSLQTDILRHNYPDIPVDTLNLSDDGRTPRPEDIHVRYDLNDLYHRERWPRIGPYDVIVMCEVIEHLYTGASTVLAGLASIVKPHSSLFLQTPNAAALHKRIQLARGKNLTCRSRRNGWIRRTSTSSPSGSWPRPPGRQAGRSPASRLTTGSPATPRSQTSTTGFARRSPPRFERESR